MYKAGCIGGDASKSLASMVFYPPNWGCDGGHGPVGLLYGQLGPDQKHPDAEVFMESGTFTNLDNRDTTPYTMNHVWPWKSTCCLPRFP